MVPSCPSCTSFRVLEHRQFTAVIEIDSPWGRDIEEPRSAVLALHQRALKKYGGLDAGVNKELLEATLAKPLQVQNTIPDATLPALAASYGFGFTKNHCFSDGNKRVAFYAVYTFLKVNGSTLNADQVEAVQIFEGLAKGTVSEKNLAKWIGNNIS